jgi:hypothetical protein
MAVSKNTNVFSEHGSKRTITWRFINAALLKRKKPTGFGISQQNARPILEKTGIRHYFDIVDGNDKTDPKYS